MTAETVEKLSPVVQDFLKAIWSAQEWNGDPITTKALAARFGTSSASVTDTVKRLAAAGLVEYTPYRPVRLTELGRRMAIAMVRRHRLIETYLVTYLDYTWTEVHDEAERLEHAVSDTFIARIDRLLGFPTHDPHGDPIPDAEGRLAHPRQAVLLGEAAPDVSHRVDRVDDSNSEVLEAAERLGCVPGQLVVPQRLRRDPAYEALSDAVWVTPDAEDAA